MHRTIVLRTVIIEPFPSTVSKNANGKCACYYREESWGLRGKEAIVGAREDESIIVNYLTPLQLTLSSRASEKEGVIHLTRKWMPVIG